MRFVYSTRSKLPAVLDSEGGYFYIHICMYLSLYTYLCTFIHNEYMYVYIFEHTCIQGRQRQRRCCEEGHTYTLHIEKF